MGEMKHYKTALEHFNALLIKQDNGCWVLKTIPTTEGYSVFSHRGSRYRAHIFAYETFVEKVPNRYELHHTCRFKRCCNPEHVTPLTSTEHKQLEENSQAFINASKTHCPAGHEYTEENTYRPKENVRICRTCSKERNTKWKLYNSLCKD